MGAGRRAKRKEEKYREEGREKREETYLETPNIVLTTVFARILTSAFSTWSNSSFTTPGTFSRPDTFQR